MSRKIAKKQSQNYAKNNLASKNNNNRFMRSVCSHQQRMGLDSADYQGCSCYNLLLQNRENRTRHFHPHPHNRWQYTLLAAGVGWKESVVHWLAVLRDLCFPPLCFLCGLLQRQPYFHLLLSINWTNAWESSSLTTRVDQIQVVSYISPRQLFFPVCTPACCNVFNGFKPAKKRFKIILVFCTTLRPSLMSSTWQIGSLNSRPVTITTKLCSITKSFGVKHKVFCFAAKIFAGLLSNVGFNYHVIAIRFQWKNNKDFISTSFFYNSSDIFHEFNVLW